MKNNKILDLLIKIGFVIILVISLYLIINGLTTKKEKVVNNDEIIETGLIVEPLNIKMKVGDEQEITVKVIPDKATYKNVTWEVGDSNIISLDNGKITALSPGNTYVKVITEKQKIERIVYVEVVSNVIPVEEIKVNDQKIELTVGETKKIEYTIIPSNATNKKISYSTNNKDVIAFDKDGNIVAVKEGNATITLKSSNDVSVSIFVIVVSKTKNKTALFVGDSITYGKDGHYSWADYIGEHYDLKKTVNAGLSGGVFSTFRGELWLVDVVKQHKSEQYDYIIMHGGINDIALVAKRGEPKGSYTANDFSGNYNTNTFVGGLETYIYTVKKQWPNAKIGYIINYRTPADKAVDPISSEYYTLIKDVCKKWNISYLDLYEGKTSSGELYSNILKVSTNTYISDGIHLTKEGYNLISPYIYAWMKTL